MKQTLSKISKGVSMFGACLTVILFLLPDDARPKSKEEGGNSYGN